MRALLVLVVGLTACQFHHGALTGDASSTDTRSPDGPTDARVDGAPGSARKKAITIHSAQVTGAQTSFPVWIVLDDPTELGARALASGDDIYFTLPGGTALEHERVRWDKATGHLEAWVRADLADAQDTVIELRYGDPSPAHAPDAPAVFSNGFAAVWHFDDSLSTTAVAEARNLSAGTALNGLASGSSVTAMLGRGFDFDGTNDEVSFTNMLTGDGSHTISAWLKVAAPSSGFGSIVTVGTPSGGGSRWFHSKYSELAAGFYDANDLQTSSSVTTNTFTLVHWVWDTATNTSTLYRNAVSVGSTTDALTINTGAGGHIGNAPMQFGPGGNTTNPINGIMDEVRIASVPRSLGWIQTEYANQSSPASFYTLGAEEIVP